MKTKKKQSAPLPRILPAAAKPKHFTVEQIRAAVLAATCPDTGNRSSDIKVGAPPGNQKRKAL